LLFGACPKLSQYELHRAKVFPFEAEEQSFVVELAGVVKNHELLIKAEIPAEGEDHFLVLAAEEGPLEELARLDRARGVLRHLVLEHVFQNVEDFCSHFASF
jgi:hypothetical protein